MKLITLFFILITGQTLFAQTDSIDNPILTDKFRFNVGVYFPSESIKVGANGDSSLIDFDEAFKFNNNETTFFFNFFWRFSKNWILATEYFAVNNAHKVALKEDIVWKDYTFKKGSFIEGGFGLDVYRIFVGRVISRGEKHEFGAGLGVHAMSVSSFIQGEAYINDENLGFKKGSVSSTIPLPNIGLWYFYAPHPKWALSGRVDWFGITVGEYSGLLWNFGPSLNYQIFKNVGIGASYRYFKASAKVDKPNWDGKFSMTFKGPLLSISGNF